MKFWNFMGTLVGVVDDKWYTPTPLLSDEAKRYGEMWRRVCNDLGEANREIEELENRLSTIEDTYGNRFNIMVKNLQEKLDAESEEIKALTSTIYGYERLTEFLQERVTSCQLLSDQFRENMTKADGRSADLQIRNNVLMRELEVTRNENTFVSEVRRALEHTLGGHGTYTIGECQGCLHAKKLLSTLKTITPQQADRFLNP